MRALLFGVASLVCLCTQLIAADGFQKLVNLMPRSANAIVLIHVEKAIDSPLGEYEGWKKNLETAFNDGISRVPPGTVRYILASDIDFEFMKPIWESAVVEFASATTTKDVLDLRGGQSDTIEGHSAAALPTDVYVVQFDERVLGGIGPANRKMAVNWLRDMKAGLRMSPYLLKAAGYADNASSEVIVALDLDGAYSLEKIVAYLKQKPAVKEGTIDVTKAASFLASVSGVRLGIKLSNPPVASVAIDCSQKCEADSDLAKTAMLRVLADGGLLLEDMRDWKCAVKESEVTLTGKLGKDGLRRVLSLVGSPTATSSPSAHKPKSLAPATTPTDPKKLVAERTKQHFDAVEAMFKDLKKDMKDAANLAVNATYFDRYASRIERLPILDVDPVMLDYSGYVAGEMRAAAGSVRTMGIRGASREAQVDYSDIDYDYAYGYRSGWYSSSAWAVPVYDGVNSVKAVGAERRKIRAEEKGVAATDVHQIRANVIDATSKVRRAMTEKYRMEF